MLTALKDDNTLIEEPAVEPVTLAQARDHLRVSSTAEDSLIRLWIRAGRQHVEDLTGRQLITATWDYILRGTPISEVELPHPPLQEVLSITYGDPAASPEATVDAGDYEVIAPTGSTCPPGRVRLLNGASWPTVSTDAPDSLRIRYVAGYGDAPADVPELLRLAILLFVGHFHMHRSDVESIGMARLPFGVEAILLAFKYSALPTLPARRLA